MTNTIQFKRGANVSLPILNAGEPGFSTDTFQTYVGDGVNNHELVDTALAQKLTNKTIDSYNSPFVLSCYNGSGAQINAMSICRISADHSGTPQIIKAQADAEANAKGMLVMMIFDIANLAIGYCIVLGRLGGFTGLTVGNIQYLSDDIAGAIEETPTSTTGEIVRIVGYAISTTEVFFNPDKTYIEVV